MTRYNDDWEAQLKQSPFKKDLFTMEHMEKVQRNLRERRHVLMVRSKGFIVSFSALMMVILILFATQPGWPQAIATQIGSWFQSEAESNIVPDPPLQPEASEDEVRFKGTTYAMASPGYWPSEAPLFEVNPELAYPLLEKTEDFVKIQAGDQTGWVSAWYITSAEEVGQTIEPVAWRETVVIEPTAFYAYPDFEAPSGFELPQGKVVRILATYGEWVHVDFQLYAEPMAGDKWIPQSALSPQYDAQQAKEGFLRFTGEGSYIYSDEEGTQPKEHITTMTTVFIADEAGNTYRISSPGGRTGYIHKSDFIPNPYSLGEGTYLEPSVKALEAFEQFRSTRDEESLRGLEPVEIFKLYQRASLVGDAGLVYDLLNHDSGYELPTREEYIEEASLPSDPNKLELLQTFAITKVKTEYTNNDEAYIVPDDHESGEWFFRLLKNDEGIWKVSWLAMQ